MMMEEQHAPPDAHLGWPPAASRRGTAAAAQGPGLLAVPAWGGRAGRRWWRCWWWWSGACCLLLLCWPGRGHDQGPPVEARRGRLVQPHGPRAPRARRSGKWGGGGRRRSDVCPLSVLCCNSSLQTTVAAEDERAKRTTVNTRTPTHPPTHPSTHPGVSAVLVPLLPAAVLLVLDVAKRLPLPPPPLPPPSWLGGHAPPAQPRRGCLVHLHGPGAPRGTRRHKWGGGGRRRREKE